MPNILIHPNSGILEFNTGTTGSSSLDASMSGAARLTFTNSGTLGITSYSTGVVDKFFVEGVNGRLFEVDDVMTGSLMSVNDIAGLPIFEVFSDDRVVMGQYNQNALVVSGIFVNISGKATVAASSTGRANLNLPHGLPPNSPVNGDIWTTNSGLYVQVSGSTVGPLITSSWVTKTSAYTAVNRDRIIADTSAGAFTITLPASPTTGTYIEINDAEEVWPTNNLTIARNGSKIDSLNEDLVCNMSAKLALTYVDATIGWRVDFEALVGGSSTATLGISIDGLSAPITTGIKGRIQVPFACAVNSWQILANQTGSIVVDVWKSSYATYPPTSTNSMAGASNKPTLTSGIKAQSTSVTGWTNTSISTNDILVFNVDSVASIQQATLQHSVTRS